MRNPTSATEASAEPPSGIMRTTSYRSRGGEASGVARSGMNAGAAASATAVAFGTVLSCVVMATRPSAYADAFATSVNVPAATWCSSTSRVTSSPLWSGALSCPRSDGRRRRRRLGGAGTAAGFCDDVQMSSGLRDLRGADDCWWGAPSSISIEPSSGWGVRRRACLSGERGRGRRSTAIGSSTAVPDTTQAVDAEFSDVGARRARRKREEQEAKERAKGGDRWSRGSADANGNANGERNSSKGKLPLPFFDVESVGLKGRWEEMGGNFLLRPPNGQAPKALLHFLGGAFVGAAPHLTYNYLLSGLAEMGFLVVATPYPLGFDYLKVCDGILDRFEEAAVPLAEEYGALPVVGIGHSCGALLQLLITCLFPDTPRAANALISFNNKPVSDAIPAFEELILPLVMQVLKEGGGQSTLFSILETLRETVDNLVDGVAESRFSPAVLENEVIPLVRQVLQITDQLPAIFQQIADGTREFTPTPQETRDVVSKMYRARRTIMVRFENDSIDESEGMKDVIQEGKTLLRMRRPLVDMELRYEIIKGSHVTPLTQNVFLNTPVDSIDPLLGVRQSMKKEFLKTVNHLGQILVDWLEESAPPIPPPNVPAGSETPTAAAGAGGSADGGWGSVSAASPTLP